jgi:hypothetical protein
MSPTIFREQGFRFFFFSREETECMYMFGEAKYWLEPEIELSRNFRLSRLQLKQIEEIIEEHYDELTSAWQEHFTG